MNFKKIEIYGFKSFADKVQVRFESGVTGIVGPNGCGKSNVADSIRWVLGEQSAKALRGSTMQDVIFNGTEKRKPQSFAEVSLYFDNSQKIFNVDYDEVVISRKLYRSGESGYSINKSPCRLKDVAELLRDSGVGRDSYSIIGQGRIDELLSAKPEERRAVFEEAAGISKLKNRKNESIKKLANTQDNLVRINDILHELEIQIEPLTKQAEIAKKYLEYKEKLKILEINNYIYQFDSSSTQKQEITNRLNGLMEELGLKEAELDKAVQNYSITADEIVQSDITIENLREELLSLTVGLEKQAGESKLLQEKISTLVENKDKLSEQIQKCNEFLKSLSEEINKVEADKQLKNTISTELENKINSISQEFLNVSNSLNSSELQAEENTAKLVESLGKLGDIKAEISSLKAEINQLNKQQDLAESQKQELILKFDNYVKSIDVINTKLTELQSKKQQVQEQVKLEKQNNIKLFYKESAVEDELKEIIGEISSSTSKINLLKEMKKENEGYVASVRKILQEAQQNSTLAGKFVNVVAKLINVPDEYQTAIDIALGSAVQNIVTKNEDDAKYVISYLKDHNLGRATFLPLTSVKPRKINDEYLDIINKSSGVYGIADELISFNKEYSVAISSLLGGTVIVKDMDSAVALAKSIKYSFKIVTLDGDVISPSGTMSGGSKKVNATSLIGREKEITDSEHNLSVLLKEKDLKELELAEIKKNKENFESVIENLSVQLHNIDLEIAKENENLNKFNELLSNLKQEESVVNDTIKTLKQDNYSLIERLNAFEKYSKDINDGKVDEGYTKNPEIYILKQRKEQLSTELTELKVKKASIDSEILSFDGELLRLNDEVEVQSNLLKQSRLELQHILSNLGQNQTQFESVVDKNVYQQNLDKLQQTRDNLAKLDARKKELNASLNNLAELKLILSTEIQRVNDRKFKEESALMKLDSDIEVMQERVWEEYGLTYNSALEYKLNEHNVEEGLQESAKLKRQIQNLGNVNVNAIESLSEVNERFKDLTEQHNDLIKAEEDLTQIINELTTEMELKFKTEFAKINTNFQGVFKELFGGGRAELKLSDPNNCLECGIEIAAEPTGKKLQNIQLLSGGERALTAIAILFAILKLRPMPFCVLDEIEAALDDANVERFAKYLKRFSKYTQFIVITHRKPTMELADNLYGVTMEERGVSKVVSVQLSEAIKTAK